MSSKEEEAIDFIRENEPEEGYFLGFSGGKDSIVLYNLVEKAEVKFEAYYSNTTVDPPEVVRFIKKEYPTVIVKRPNWRGHTSFFGMIPERGFPTKFTRWCCDELKKNPTRYIPLHNRLMGIRAEESNKRAKRPRIDRNPRYKKMLTYKPIFYWTDNDIWEYIHNNKLEYPSLYDEGFKRLGCVVCPFLCNKRQVILNQHKDRWPKMYKAFEKAMFKLWDTKEKYRQWEKGYSKTFEEFLDNWYHGR